MLVCFNLKWDLLRLVFSDPECERTLMVCHKFSAYFGSFPHKLYGHWHSKAPFTMQVVSSIWWCFISQIQTSPCVYVTCSGLEQLGLVSNGDLNFICQFSRDFNSFHWRFESYLSGICPLEFRCVDIQDVLGDSLDFFSLVPLGSSFTYLVLAWKMVLSRSWLLDSCTTLSSTFDKLFLSAKSPVGAPSAIRFLCSIPGEDAP